MQGDTLLFHNGLEVDRHNCNFVERTSIFVVDNFVVFLPLILVDDGIGRYEAVVGFKAVAEGGSAEANWWRRAHA